MRVALVGAVSVEQLRPWLKGAAPVATVGLGTRLGSPVAQLALGLLERGHHVLVVSLAPQVVEEVVLDGPRLRVRIGPYRRRHRARDAFRVERRYIRRVLSAEVYDIVHAQWTYEYALAALRVGGPALVTVRDWAPRDVRLQPTPYRVVRLLMNIAALARSEYLTVTTPYMEERLRRWNRSPMAVIPNALPDEWFAERVSRPDLEAPVLIAVNQGFGKLKNVRTLLRAFAMILDQRPGATLRLIGPAYAVRGVAHTWARQNGLDRNVEFLGEVPHAALPELLDAADLFVHPSLQESLGMVVVEAMARGLPVVGGSSSGAVPWLLDGGQAGALVDVRSPEAIAQAALDMVADEQAWWALSRGGHARARTLFQGPNIIDEYVGLYRRVLDETTSCGNVRVCR